MNDKIAKMKDAVAELKRTKANVDAALSRIELLERTLINVSSDLNRINEVFGLGLRIEWFVGGSWKSTPLKEVINGIRAQIEKVQP